MISCTRVAAALLLSIGLCQAARDEGADKKGVLQAGSREADLETIGVSTDHFTRKAIAKGDGNTTEPEDDEHSEASDNGEHVSGEAAEEQLSDKDSGSEHGSDDGSGHSSDDGSGSEHGSDEDGSRGTEDEGHSLAQQTVEREQRPVLCEVTKDLEPSKALRQIEECVKQLENIKEGTLQQGKSSWHHNNEYVKKLADMENRMTELARPEPFEIAFAVDQADMFDKLKNRLQAITLDLPKLQGKDAGELPGIPEKPEETAPPSQEDAASGEPPEVDEANSAGSEAESHADDGATHASDEDRANSAGSEANSAGSEAESHAAKTESDAEDAESDAANTENDEGTDSAEKPEAKPKVEDSS